MIEGIDESLRKYIEEAISGYNLIRPAIGYLFDNPKKKIEDSYYTGLRKIDSIFRPLIEEKYDIIKKLEFNNIDPSNYFNITSNTFVNYIQEIHNFV